MAQSVNVTVPVAAPLTAEQAISILKSRRLQLIPVGIDQWTVRTFDGTRAGGKNTLYATPELALQAAEDTILALEERERENASASLLDSLSQGKFSIRPRDKDIIDPDTGQRSTVTVFDGFSKSSPITVVSDVSTFQQAVIEMRKKGLS